MAIFTPSTFVKLCNVPYDPSYINTINFSSEGARDGAFSGLSGLTFNDFSFVRDNGVLRIPANIDTIANYNYCYYDNVYFNGSGSSSGNRNVYCFIVKMEYITDEVTAVYIRTDVFTTWFPFLTIGNGYVEREHVSDDTPYTHLEPENIDTGDFVQYSLVEQNFNTTAVIAVAVLRDATSYQLYQGEIKSGLYNQIQWQTFPFTAAGATQLTQLLQTYNTQGQIDAIVDIMILPQQCIDLYTSTLNVPKPTSLGGYTPRNKKLLSYPYCYLSVSNNNGVCNVYKWEYFNTDTWAVTSSLSSNAAICAYPSVYKNKEQDMDESITITNFPHCTWNASTYQTWFALNTNSINATKSNFLMRTATNLGGSLINVVQTLANAPINPIKLPGFAADTVSSLYNIWANMEPTMEQINNFNAQLDDKELTPDALRGNYSVNNASQYWRKWKFSFRYMGVHPTYMNKLDSYFDMFGYKIGQNKVPNINGRPNWNFVKVNRLTINGECPTEDLVEIKSAFARGITFWHTSFSGVGNYNLGNSA